MLVSVFVRDTPGRNSRLDRACGYQRQGYDRELMKDPQVLGVTLFKCGYGSTWKSFDLEPVMPWLLKYLEKRGR